MLGRRTTRLLADAYRKGFRTSERDGRGNYVSKVAKRHLYDFLYERDFDSWLCNSLTSFSSPDTLRDFIMKLHTTESLKAASWSRARLPRRPSECSPSL
jgi:hypothetical protein